MAFSLREATCTAVGSFNIYIFRPDWIAGQLGRNTTPAGLPPHEVLVDLTQPGVRVRFPRERFEWTVRPDRLIVGTIHPGEDSGDDPGEDGSPTPPDCGTAVARVLDELPVTPLRGAGNTFRFTAPLADAVRLELAGEALLSGWPNPPDESTVRSSGFGCVLDGPGGSRVSLSLTRLEPRDDDPGKLLAVVNVHGDDCRAEACAGHARRFLNDYEDAITLLRTHLNAEVAT